MLRNLLHRSVSMASLSSFGSNGIHSVTVLGSGLMGSGIAQVAAQSGYSVNLVDTDSNVLKRGVASIETSLNRVAKKQPQLDVKAAIANISASTDMIQCASRSDLIIEAVPEILSLKKEIYAKLNAASPANCIFASNTSSLSIKEMSSEMPAERLARFAGLHFFNPVPVMRLVELVCLDQTTESTKQELKEFCQKIGKTVVTCKDTPGFIVNRLLVPNLLESIRLVERGDASMQDVDLAMKLGASYPIGPFELADYVGLDTVKFIVDGWSQRYPDNPLFNRVPMLDDLVAKNRLGKKTGAGFYDYTDDGKIIKK